MHVTDRAFFFEPDAHVAVLETKQEAGKTTHKFSNPVNEKL